MRSDPESEKRTGAAPCGVTPADLMAISRILFSTVFDEMERRSFILLRHFEGPEQPLRAATITRRWPPVNGDRAGGPSLLFCLAPRRVCRAPCLRLGRWALTRRFTLASSAFLQRSLASVGAIKRSVFCDTFRRKELSFSAPLLSQGGLPCGVRTFLSGFLRSRSDRPPTRKAYLRGAIIQGVSFAGWQARSRMLGAAEERD